MAPPPRVELVSALRQSAQHVATPVQFIGREEVWLHGETAKAVIAAAREAMSNVDRHAQAALLRVTVSSDTVVLEDDGVGFDPRSPRSGHGVTDSIIARMRRAGGGADIRSAPGSGTVIELSWAPLAPSAVKSLAVDPDRLIDRIRVRYGLALTAYALANLAFAASHAIITTGRVAAQAALGVVAATSTLAAVPGIRYHRWRAAWLAAAALLVVTVVQPALLPPEMVGGYAHWAQSSIGWCVLPLVLGLPTRVGAAVLVLYWVVGAAVEVIRHPFTPVLVNIGLGTASILAVQLFALVFNGLVRGAAADAQAETSARQQLITRDRVARALRAEYQRRYAKLVESVVPLLEMLSRNGVVDERMQRRARAESRRLRALFDQATTFDHPLMQRLRPLVDAAEARGVDVVIDVAGRLPDLSEGEITAVVRPLGRVTEATTISARLVISSSADELNASVVSEGFSGALGLAEEFRAGGDDIDIVTSDNSVWFLIRHPLQKGARDHAVARDLAARSR